MAILLVYFPERCWRSRSPFDERQGSPFRLLVLLAFLPAALIGAAAHGFIKSVLFETPMLICVVLIVGGVILYAIDRLPLTLATPDVFDYRLRSR